MLFSTSPLFDLAPEGGYLAAGITASAGGLLHHLFTLTLTGGMFLWPDPEIYISPGVTRLPALGCTDFPHRSERTARTPNQPEQIHHTENGE